ncbi:MAG: hypothetical protein AAB577_00090 [Patescibacteria group bacterium]
MKYSIKALNIAGSNRFGKTIAATKGMATEDIEKEDLEKVLRSIKDCDGFYLTADLPFSLEALVLRNLKPEKEIVRLIIAKKQIDLLRDSYDQVGDIGVSCDPDGDEVPVATLNIKFRNTDDKLTDRGVVWVNPGSPATMDFVIKIKALETPGMVAKIVTAAEETVKARVLKYQ